MCTAQHGQQVHAALHSTLSSRNHHLSQRFLNTHHKSNSRQNTHQNNVQLCTTQCYLAATPLRHNTLLLLLLLPLLLSAC